jgi:phosphatidate cytidylyltransferase
MFRQRLVTAVVLGLAAVAGILYLPTALVALLTTVMAMTAAWEWIHLPQVPPKKHLAWLYIVAIGGLVQVGWRVFDHFPEAVFVGAAIWTVLLGVVAVRKYQNSKQMVLPGLILGAVVIVPALALVPVLHGQGEFGPRLVLAICAVIWIGDIGAYGVGKRWGFRLLAPNISPGKTVEGALGGGLFAVATGVVAITTITGPAISLAWLVLAMVLVSAAAVLSDLLESMVKRASGKKDSGQLLPGHGGLLDRIDSLLGAVPIFTGLWFFWLNPAAIG